VILSLEVDRHQPQWQRRVRVSLGEPGHMIGHGTMYVSTEFATMFVHLCTTAVMGCAVRVVDRTGAEPTFQTTREHPSDG